RRTREPASTRIRGTTFDRERAGGPPARSGIPPSEPYPRNPGLDRRAGIRFFVVADNDAPASVRDQVLNLQPRGQRGPFTRRRLHDNLALSVEKRERQKIVREYGRSDLRDLRKHLPDVEDRGQRAQQLVARLDVPHAVSLERERVLQRLVVLRVLNGQRNLIRDKR